MSDSPRTSKISKPFFWSIFATAKMMLKYDSYYGLEIELRRLYRVYLCACHMIVISCIDISSTDIKRMDQLVRQNLNAVVVLVDTIRAENYLSSAWLCGLHRNR